MLDKDTKLQLVKEPHILLYIIETLELDNEEIYIRYKQEDKEEEWTIIKLDLITKIFEDYVDKDLLDMINIEDGYPEQGEDILGVDSDGFKYYCYRCTHAPGCKTWKSSGYPGTLGVHIIKWKYIN